MDIYKHYKGGLYQLITLGKIESDGELVAVYRCLKTGQVWVRPFNEWALKFKREQGIDELTESLDSAELVERVNALEAELDHINKMTWWERLFGWPWDKKYKHIELVRRD